MSGNFTYLITNGFIHISLHGDFSVAELLAYIEKALSDPKANIPALILINPQNVTTTRTVQDVEEIARGFEKISSKIAKTAVVTESDLHYGNARMGIAFSNPSTLNASAVRTIDEAILFLTT